VRTVAARGNWADAVRIFCQDPQSCGSALPDLFRSLVKARQLKILVEGLTKVGSDVSPLSQSVLRETLLAMPVDSDAMECADFAELATRASAWESEDHCMYFAAKVRHAVLEFLHEAGCALEEIRCQPADRRVLSGVTIIGVRFKPGLKAGELAVDAFRPGSVDADRRGLKKGDSVGVSAHGGWSWSPGLLEAEVLNEWPLVIKFLSGQEQTLLVTRESGLFRVDKLANRQQYGRIVAALHLLAAPHKVNLGEKSGKKQKIQMKASASVVQTVVSRTGVAAAAESRCFAVGSVRSECVSGLNASQQRAMQAAVSQSVVLIQGPPGTGKTALAVRILQQWCRTGGAGTCLAASDSNIAVDNIVENVAGLNVNPVRLGRPETTRPELLGRCADDIACKVLGVQRLKDCLDQRRRHDVMQEVIKKADVLCTTAIGAGSGIIERYGFRRVLLDEASQATELATVVPLSHGCEQLVLLGDHCQLPPTVSCDAAIKEGLAVSLFERLIQSGVTAHLLETQYRMNPTISEFPRCHFYSGRLQDGITADRRPALEGFRWPQRGLPMCFLSVDGWEQSNGTSFENAAEAERVVRVLKEILEDGVVKPQDLGVVTPYGAQVRLLRRMLARAGIPTFREANGVEVASVDGYQGREKEGIIMSTVRSSRSSGIGFVADWRRANVAFTRARRGVIVIGNPATLARDEGTWLPWLHWIRSNRFYQGDMPSLPSIRPNAPRVGLDACGTALQSTPPNFQKSHMSAPTPAEERLDFSAQLSFRAVVVAGPSPKRGTTKTKRRSRSKSSARSESAGARSAESNSDKSGSSGDKSQSGSDKGGSTSCKSDSVSIERRSRPDNSRNHKLGRSRNADVSRKRSPSRKLVRGLRRRSRSRSLSRRRRTKKTSRSRSRSQLRSRRRRKFKR